MGNEQHGPVRCTGQWKEGNSLLKAYLQVPGPQAKAERPLVGAACERVNLVPHDVHQVVAHQAAGDGRLGVPRPEQERPHMSRLSQQPEAHVLDTPCIARDPQALPLYIYSHSSLCVQHYKHL